MPETIKKPRTPRTPVAHDVATHAVAHAPKEHKAAADLKVSGKYIEAVGRRKTSIARVRLFEGTGKMIVNGKEAKQYFPLARLIADAKAPLTSL